MAAALARNVTNIFTQHLLRPSQCATPVRVCTKTPSRRSTPIAGRLNAGERPARCPFYTSRV